MLKLPLREPKPYPPGYRGNTVNWTSSAPFVENTRGVLIHRPQSVRTITMLGKAHIGIKYWCGNGTAGKRSLTFLSEPPPGALLCAACEARARAAGLPSAEALAGRHVHLGKVVAMQLCCRQSNS